MPELLPQYYFLSCSLRPAFRNRRIDTRVLRLDPEADFEWWDLAINAQFDCHIRIQTSKGWLMNEPIRACNLGTPVLPMRLFREILLPKGSEVTFRIRNHLEQTRMWNRIEIGLFGYKVFEVGVHESPITSHPLLDPRHRSTYRAAR